MMRWLLPGSHPRRDIPRFTSHVQLLSGHWRALEYSLDCWILCIFGSSMHGQEVIKQFSNIREPFILDREEWALTLLRLDLRFSALQFPPTPSLFLRRQWSNRTSYTVLPVSWALLLLEVCIEAFVIAKPKEIGSYFGGAGLWCWITPAYPVPRYATSYLLMLISAGLSFILYFLVFFRLRSNITV